MPQRVDSVVASSVLLWQKRVGQKYADIRAPAMKNHISYAKVYLEDTDAQGIVYHANYLKYCERARTDVLGICGYSLGEMHKQERYFVVFEMNLRFLKPARLHDELQVRSSVSRDSEYRLTFTQDVTKLEAEGAIFSARSVVVSIDGDGVLCPLPEDLLVESSADAQ